MKPNVENRLHVEGVILECTTTQPRTHLGPKQAAREATFDLDISRAWLTDGTEKDPMMVFPSSFAGDFKLLEQFAVGDRVRVTATTLSGREIAEMVTLSDPESQVGTDASG